MQPRLRIQVRVGQQGNVKTCRNSFQISSTSEAQRVITIAEFRCVHKHLFDAHRGDEPHEVAITAVAGIDTAVGDGTGVGLMGACPSGKHTVQLDVMQQEERVICGSPGGGEGAVEGIVHTVMHHQLIL